MHRTSLMVVVALIHWLLMKLPQNHPLLPGQLKLRLPQPRVIWSRELQRARKTAGKYIGESCMSFEKTSIMVQATLSGSTSAFMLRRRLSDSQYVCCATDVDATRRWLMFSTCGKRQERSDAPRAKSAPASVVPAQKAVGDCA